MTIKPRNGQLTLISKSYPKRSIFTKWDTEIRDSSQNRLVLAVRSICGCWKLFARFLSFVNAIEWWSVSVKTELHPRSPVILHNNLSRESHKPFSHLLPRSRDTSRYVSRPIPAPPATRWSMRIRLRALSLLVTSSKARWRYLRLNPGDSVELILLHFLQWPRGPLYIARPFLL